MALPPLEIPADRPPRSGLSEIELARVRLSERRLPTKEEIAWVDVQIQTEESRIEEFAKSSGIIGKLRYSETCGSYCWANKRKQN